MYTAYLSDVHLPPTVCITEKQVSTAEPVLSMTTEVLNWEHTRVYPKVSGLSRNKINNNKKYSLRSVKTH
jgi:hypothetical protein